MANAELRSPMNRGTGNIAMGYIGERVGRIILKKEYGNKELRSEAKIDA
jgi:hypothetical protein